MISDLNYNYISYAFKNTDKFFKEISYTGTGAGHKLNYDLKDTLGMAIFRNIDSGGEWFVWHKKVVHINLLETIIGNLGF